MKGDIFFSASNSWISKAIRWFTKSNVSHTGIIINNQKRKLVLEAATRQVHITTYDKHYKKGYIEIYRPKIDEKMVDKAIDCVISKHLEKPYGYLQLLGFAIVCLLKRIGIKIKNPLKMHSICSEVSRDYGAFLPLSEKAKQEFAKLDPDTTSPDDLRNVIKNLPESFERVWEL